MIKEFQGEYRWLSNFAPVKIILDGRQYSSVEHAYMSAKSDNVGWKEFCSDERNKPGEVKRKSKGITLIKNWDIVKIRIMKECIDQKFDQEPYRSLLIKTGNDYIQEGNNWGDVFWGVCLKSGIGKNNLGLIIMEKRDRLL